MKKIISTIMILTSVSFAHRNSDTDLRCLAERWELVGRAVRMDAACAVTVPLKLISGEIKYKKLGYMNVRYFEGEYTRRYVETWKYRHQIINICNGQKTFDEVERYRGTYSLVHSIKNPNLNLDLDASYKLAPMTDAEAAKAFDDTKAECEHDNSPEKDVLSDGESE